MQSAEDLGSLGSLKALGGADASRSWHFILGGERIRFIPSSPILLAQRWASRIYIPGKMVQSHQSRVPNDLIHLRSQA